MQTINLLQTEKRNTANVHASGGLGFKEIEDSPTNFSLKDLLLFNDYRGCLWYNVYC